MIYQKDKDTIETKIFGKKFVQFNKNKGIIIIKNKQKKLEEKLETNQKENYVSVKLKLLENIVDLNSMFKGCTTLYSISHISKLNEINEIKFGKSKIYQNIYFKYTDISDVTDNRWMFAGCNELKEIKGIDKFKTNKVTNMQAMFSICDVIIWSI